MRINPPVDGFRPSTPPVTAETLDDVLASYPAVAVHFWAEWNGHDRMMDQVVQEIQPRFNTRVHFVSCDVDQPENLDLCKRCNVGNIPYLAVFVGTEQRSGIKGLLSSDLLTDELESRLDGSRSVRKWWEIF